MCWEQSRRKRTIATSRSEATTTETEPDTQTTARPQESLCPAHPGKKRCPPSATVTEPPRGKRLPLDKLFQERTHRPRYPRPLGVPRCLRLLPEQHRHLANGLASATTDSTAAASPGYSFDAAIPMSSS